MNTAYETSERPYLTETTTPEVPARPLLSYLVGRTITGPIYQTYAVVTIAPSRIVFENLWELGCRAINPEAKVFGSIAGRHADSDAFFAHLAFTGLAAGSLLAAPPLAQLAIFDELTTYLLLKGDATGLESFFLTAWQSVWIRLGGEQQRQAADIWNGLVRHGSVCQKFGIVAYDGRTRKAVPFGPTALVHAGFLGQAQSDPWGGGYGPSGQPTGFPGSGTGEGEGGGARVPQNPGNSSSDSGAFPGTSSALPASSNVSTNSSNGLPGTSSGLPPSAANDPSIDSAGLSGTSSGLSNATSGAGLLDQDPKGPVGGILRNISARGDQIGDGERQVNAGEREKSQGEAALLVAGIAIATSGGAGPALVGGVLLGVWGLVSVIEGGATIKQGKDKITDANEKARNTPRNLPPDILRASTYVIHVTSREIGDVYAKGDREAGKGSSIELGMRDIAANLLVGDGLTAFLVTNDRGHVSIPSLSLA